MSLCVFLELTMITINVIMTCHNRKEKSRQCIISLLKQNGIQDKFHLRFFICDDGSTDGTSEAIKEVVPHAVITVGSGNLFWAKGMAMAMESANMSKCDFYLMINDDVIFNNNMLEIMLNTYEYGIKKCGDNKIAVSGACYDQNSGAYSYGGEKIISSGIKEITDIVYPNIPPQICHHANWNCFLISQNYYFHIGDIDKYYAHSYADYDYSNRITADGGRIYISCQYIGTCCRNEPTGTWKDKQLGLMKRLKRLEHPTGIPLKSSIHYWRKFDRKHWLLRVMRPYIVILRDIFIKT